MIAFLVALAFLAAAVGLAALTGRRKRCPAGMESFARRVGGTVGKQGVWGPLVACFRLGGSRAEVAIPRVSPEPEEWILLSVDLEGRSPGSLSLSPHWGGSAVARLFGAQDLPVGSFNFDMRTGIVHCAKCRTPHHRECWTYLGVCSTFACGGTSFGPERP